MKQKLKVEYVDGRTETVRANAWVESEVERRYDVSLMQSTRREHIYYAAWVALGEEGKDRGRDFDHWMKTVETATLEPLPEGESPDPTKPDPTSGSSSS